MQTLYDVLGLSRLATQQQIDLAYNQNIESLTNESNSASIEQNAIQAKAIKEAYSILSSPPRRQNYDTSLRAKEQVSYQIVEQPPTPWGKIIIAFSVVAACLLFYNHQQNKAEKERKALEVQQAQAKAMQAEQEALVEQTRIEQQKLYTQRQAEARRNYEMERARYEGNVLSERNRNFDERTARDQERAKQQEAQLASNDAARRDREAKNRAANEAAAMRRALQMPVGQPNYYRSTPGGTIQNR